MMTADDQDYLLGRLDGYLDALSIINGDFRDCRYSAWILNVPISQIETDVSCAYEPAYPVSFGPLLRHRRWLGYLQEALERWLLPRPFGVAASQQERKHRIYQIVWYVMEMIRMLTDDFAAEVLLECPFSMDCEGEEVAGRLFLIALQEQEQVLVINLLGLEPTAVS